MFGECVVVVARGIKPGRWLSDRIGKTERLANLFRLGRQGPVVARLASEGGMKSIPLLDATRRLGAPPNWNHETDGICHTLEICDRDGWMISGWLPGEAERKRIADGGPIFLHIQGRSHPVVSLTVGNVAELQVIDPARPIVSDS